MKCFEHPSVHPQEDLYVQFYGIYFIILRVCNFVLRVCNFVLRVCNFVLRVCNFVNLRVLRPAISTQVFLGFPVSISKC